MGWVHVNTKMGDACTYITSWCTSKSYIFVSETSYSPCGTFLFRTKPIFALNACVEQQALVSTTYQVEDTFHTRSDTNVECFSLRYNPNKSYACVLVFSSFCVEWPRLPLGHIVSWTSNHATCHVYSPKAVETIVLVLNFNFARGDRCWCNCKFGSIFGSFRQEKWIAVLFYWSEFKDRKELNICKPSKKRVRTCKDDVIGREITTIPKIAVDNVIFWIMWFLWLLC